MKLEEFVFHLKSQLDDFAKWHEAIGGPPIQSEKDWEDELVAYAEAKRNDERVKRKGESK